MQALCGLLRVRTCPELRAARVYGRAVEDGEHPQLYHIVACDPHDCSAFDLEIANRQGFMPQSNGRATHPVIQARPLRHSTPATALPPPRRRALPWLPAGRHTCARPGC